MLVVSSSRAPPSCRTYKVTTPSSTWTIRGRPRFGIRKPILLPRFACRAVWVVVVEEGLTMLRAQVAKLRRQQQRARTAKAESEAKTAAAAAALAERNERRQMMKLARQEAAAARAAQAAGAVDGDGEVRDPPPPHTHILCWPVTGVCVRAWRCGETGGRGHRRRAGEPG